MTATGPGVGAAAGPAGRGTIAAATCLADAARMVLMTPCPHDKAACSHAAADLWRNGKLSLKRSSPAMPDHPARPDAPKLTHPRYVPKRGFDTPARRIALIHALAHIELNAIDLAWDIAGRFAADDNLPRAFCDDWIRVADEEATHFTLLCERLQSLGAAYGDLAAHDGLWQAAAATAHDLLARLAIVPLVLEARGLDVTPPMIERLKAAGDAETAAVLEIIYRDEKEHVASGFRWYRHLCAQRQLPLEPTFHLLVRKYFRGLFKPPFNDEARSAAGLSASFYQPLA